MRFGRQSPPLLAPGGGFATPRRCPFRMLPKRRVGPAHIKAQHLESGPRPALVLARARSYKSIACGGPALVPARARSYKLPIGCACGAACWRAGRVGFVFVCLHYTVRSLCKNAIEYAKPDENLALLALTWNWQTPGQALAYSSYR